MCLHTSISGAKWMYSRCTSHPAHLKPQIVAQLPSTDLQNKQDSKAAFKVKQHTDTALTILVLNSTYPYHAFFERPPTTATAKGSNRELRPLSIQWSHLSHIGSWTHA